MQVDIDGVTYVSHEDPVWRSEKNYMALVDLSPFGMEGMVEQLWLREDEKGCGYEVCCIPFYAYGLALGDVVEKSEVDVVQNLIGGSGRRVLRVFFVDPRPLMDSRPALRVAMEQVGIISEWNGDRHVAIDVCDISVMQPIFDAVQGEIRNGTAFWEWSDSKSFAAS